MNKPCSRTILRTFSAALFLSAIISPALWAQAATTGAIAGRVLNATNGSYLNRARVTVEASHALTFTDNSGYFRLDHLPEGSALVHVFYTGLAPFEARVAVEAGKTANLDVSLGGVSSTDLAAGEGEVVRVDQFIVKAQIDTDQKSIAINKQRFAPNLVRLASKDQGVVFRHGVGPNQCDYLGARDVWVWQHAGTYYMHYDGAGPKGWLVCLAISKDLEHWTPQGAVLGFGAANSNDSAAASYGTTYFDGQRWHMFYLGTPHVTPAPDCIPGFPYLTMKAESTAPVGPWDKRYDVTPFRVKNNSYYAGCASPGYIIKQDSEYLMFFSASTEAPIFRTISLARTRDLDGPWTLAAEPLLPPTEQIENSSLYFEKENKTWFLFTNHVGIKDGLEYTDAIWVYWSKNPTRWDPACKAVVLDSSNCKWSKHIIGLPSVVQVGKRLAVFYDGQDADPIPPGVKSHMNRDIGLAWLDLPLTTPVLTAK